MNVDMPAGETVMFDYMKLQHAGPVTEAKLAPWQQSEHQGEAATARRALTKQISMAKPRLSYTGSTNGAIMSF